MMRRIRDLESTVRDLQQTSDEVTMTRQSLIPSTYNQIAENDTLLRQVRATQESGKWLRHGITVHTL
jgi:hypothetical protein